MTTSTLEDTLAAVKDGAAKKAAEDAKQYRDLVGKVARGQAVPPEIVVSKLSALGKPAEAFEQDVKAMAHRVALRAEFDALADRQRQFNTTNAAWHAANREYEAAVAAANAKLTEVCGPLEEQLAEADAGVKRSQAAEQTLRERCDDPERIAKRDATAKRLGEANTALAKLLADVADGKAKVLPAAEADLRWAVEAPKMQGLLEPAASQWEAEKAERVRMKRGHVEFIQKQIREAEAVHIPAARKEVAEAEADFAAALAEFLNP